MAQSRFPVDPQLIAVGVNVRPEGLIADLVLPRQATVDKSEFKYNWFDPKQNFTIPDTKVGRRGAVNQVTFQGEERTGMVEDYGLEEPIPAADRQDVAWDEQARSVEYLTGLIRLDREVRVAGRVFDETIYDADKTAAIADGSRFDDAASDPLGLLDDYLDKCLLRPTVLVFGQPAWTKFRRHPGVVSAALGNSGTAGRATAQQVAELLQVRQVIVGNAYINTARKGQAATYARAWGKGVAGLHLDPTAGPMRGATFGYTVTQRVAGNTFMAGALPNPKMGLHGGVDVRAGESVAEVIAASFLGFYLRTVVD